MNDIIITKLYNKLKASHSDDAAGVLFELLITGKITASAFDPHNEDHVVRLEQNHWQTFGEKRAEQIFREGSVTAKIGMPYDEAAYQMHVFVPDWSFDLLPPEETPPINRGGKRGRRETIEWQVVSAGVAYLMSQEKKPKNLEDLIQDVSAWCDKHFGEGAAPGETVLKDNFSGLFRLIAGENPKTIFPNGVKPKRERKKPRKKSSGRVGN